MNKVALLENLLYRILTQADPRLEDNLKVKWGGRAHYSVSKNGKGVVFQTSLLPSDPRLRRILSQAPSELLNLLENRAFPIPELRMTPSEASGWEELLRLGARPFTREAHALDLRTIPIPQNDGALDLMPRFLKALTLVCPQGSLANHWLEDGQGRPIGVYTKERTG